MSRSKRTLGVPGAPLRLPLCVLTPQATRVECGHDPDRYVQIGSLTKPLTGTLLAALIRAGRMSGDDPIEMWLRTPPGTGITLRHLALHTSGLPRLPPRMRFAGADPYAWFDAEALQRAVLARLPSLVQEPPGSREEYSNLGYAVLGAARDDGRWVLAHRIGGRARTVDKIGLQEMASQPLPDE